MDIMTQGFDIVKRKIIVEAQIRGINYDTSRINRINKKILNFVPHFFIDND